MSCTSRVSSVPRRSSSTGRSRVSQPRARFHHHRVLPADGRGGAEQFGVRHREDARAALLRQYLVQTGFQCGEAGPGKGDTGGAKFGPTCSAHRQLAIDGREEHVKRPTAGARSTAGANSADDPGGTSTRCCAGTRDRPLAQAVHVGCDDPVRPRSTPIGTGSAPRAANASSGPEASPTRSTSPQPRSRWPSGSAPDMGDTGGTEGVFAYGCVCPPFLALAKQVPAGLFGCGAPGRSS